MKINQIAANDAVTQDILTRTLSYSTLLRNHIEMYAKAGDAAMGRKELGALSISSRELDRDYTPIITKAEYFPTYRKVFGAVVRLDVARERMGFDIPSEMSNQLRREAMGIATGFNSVLINGDASVDAKQFNGLKKLVKEGQKIKVGGAANGLRLSVGNQTDKTVQQTFLESLDATIESCIGVNKVIITNGTIIAKLNSVAREYIGYTTDSFGKRIVSYNGIPLVNIEEGGASVLPFNETVGTATTCSSVYVASFEEEAGLSFLTVPEGFKVYSMQKVGVFYENQIEMIVDTALFRDKAISKLEGLYI